jgi:hypothetical protein
MIPSSLNISRSALELLFDLLSTPKMELSAEQFGTFTQPAPAEK